MGTFGNSVMFFIVMQTIMIMVKIDGSLTLSWLQIIVLFAFWVGCMPILSALIIEEECLSDPIHEVRKR